MKNNHYIKTASELQLMKTAAITVTTILEHLRVLAQKPGTTGTKLNAVAHKMILKAHCQPNFLNYHGFPAVLCVSVNHQLVHGIPNQIPFQPGDLVSLDLGCSYQKYHADSAISFGIGKLSACANDLLDATIQSLALVIKKLQPGMKIHQIGCIIEGYITSRGYYLTDQYSGHGIGQNLHEEPFILNVCRLNSTVVLKPGMVLCIEPMVLIDSPATCVANDQWTVVSQNHKLTCHVEKMVLITQSGAEVITNYGNYKR